MPSPSFGASPSSICAWASIAGLTDAIAAQYGIASIAVTTTKRLYRITMSTQSQGVVNNIMPLAWTHSTVATGRQLRIAAVSDGVYDIGVVDSTGAAADATGDIVVAFMRGPKVN